MHAKTESDQSRRNAITPSVTNGVPAGAESVRGPDVANRSAPVDSERMRSRSVRTGPFRVTNAFLHGSCSHVLDSRDCPVFAIVLDGLFTVDCNRHLLEIERSSVLILPAGEGASARAGRDGTQILHIEPDFADPEIPESIHSLFARIGHFRHARIDSLARKACRELLQRDGLAAVALRAMVLEMFVLAARLDKDTRCPDALPAWFSHASAIIQARFLENLRIRDIASEVGVHPGHLARTFREHYRMPLGAYLRRLRLDWAARKLAETDDPLTRIALEAGFADQSHFTRAFRQYMGATPARCRRNWRQ